MTGLIGLLISALVFLIVIYVILYVVQMFIPIPPRILQLVYIVIGLIMLLYLLNALGYLGGPIFARGTFR